MLFSVVVVKTVVKQKNAWRSGLIFTSGLHSYNIDFSKKQVFSELNNTGAYTKKVKILLDKS